MYPLLSIAMARRRSQTMMTLAATTVIALALVISVTAASSSPGPTAFIAFENAFKLPVHNLTIQCDSDVAPHPVLHFVRPQESFLLDVNTEREHRWVCTFSTEKMTGHGRQCGQEFSAKFVVWESTSNLPPQLPAGKKHPTRCFTPCKWLVNDGGLWMRRYPHGPLDHVYNWPADNC